MPISNGFVLVVQEEGVEVTNARYALNFVGSAVTAADDASNKRVNITTSIKRTMSVLVNDSTALTSGDGKAYFPRIPSHMNGWNITEVAANMVAGTGQVTIMIHNLTQSADILSTALTIDANEKDSKDAATPAVIDTNEDDLQTGDRLRVDIDGAGTGTTWLDVQFTAEAP